METLKQALHTESLRCDHLKEKKKKLKQKYKESSSGLNDLTSHTHDVTVRGGRDTSATVLAGLGVPLWNFGLVDLWGEPKVKRSRQDQTWSELWVNHDDASNKHGQNSATSQKSTIDSRTSNQTTNSSTTDLRTSYLTTNPTTASYIDIETVPASKQCLGFGCEQNDTCSGHDYLEPPNPLNLCMREHRQISCPCRQVDRSDICLCKNNIDVKRFNRCPVVTKDRKNNENKILQVSAQTRGKPGLQTPRQQGGLMLNCHSGKYQQHFVGLDLTQESNEGKEHCERRQICAELHHDEQPMSFPVVPTRCAYCPPFYTQPSYVIGHTSCRHPGYMHTSTPTGGHTCCQTIPFGRASCKTISSGQNCCQTIPTGQNCCQTIPTGQNCCQTIPTGQNCCQTIPTGQNCCQTIPTGQNCCQTIPTNQASCKTTPTVVTGQTCCKTTSFCQNSCHTTCTGQNNRPPSKEVRNDHCCAEACTADHKVFSPSCQFGFKSHSLGLDARPRGQSYEEAQPPMFYQNFGNYSVQQPKFFRHVDGLLTDGEGRRERGGHQPAGSPDTSIQPCHHGNVTDAELELDRV